MITGQKTQKNKKNIYHWLFKRERILKINIIDTDNYE